MIYTARQLEDLHKTNGHVRLPIGARLTPMAHDWLRTRKITIVYGDSQQSPGTAVPALSKMEHLSRAAGAPVPVGQWLWWCDGPCGAAKAALAAQAKETNLQPLAINAEPKYLVSAIKHLASEVKSDRAVGGVLLVQSGAAAVVYANRCPSLRAILGTCRDAVQQGIDLVGANVLVIETPYQTLQQVKNVISLFIRMRREPNDDVKRQLQEMAACA